MPILENLENSKRVLKIDHHSLTHQAEETAVNTSAQLLSVFFSIRCSIFFFFHEWHQTNTHSSVTHEVPCCLGA